MPIFPPPPGGVVYTKTAVQCPPIVVPPSIFYPSVTIFPDSSVQPVGPPWTTPPVVSRKLPPVWVPTINTAIAQADLGGRLGTVGGYGVEWGLGFLDIDSFGLPVTQGVASLDKPAMMPRLSNTDPTVPAGNPNDIAFHAPLVDDQDNYIWLGPNGPVSPVLGSLTPPSGIVTYLGLAHMALGVLTRDPSGVLYRSPGGLWLRKTADVGMPGDTPDGGIYFINYSLGDGSRWLWDGTSYIQQPSTALNLGSLTRTPIIFGIPGLVVQGVTRYLYPGVAAASATEVKVRLRESCTAKQMAVRSTASPGTGTDVYTLRKNGVDTALTVTLGTADTEDEDVTHSVTFAAGDDLSLKVVTGVASVASDPMVSIILQ